MPPNAKQSGTSTLRNVPRRHGPATETKAAPLASSLRPLATIALVVLLLGAFAAPSLSSNGGVLVPTQDDLDALTERVTDLEARVSELENGQGDTSDEPDETDEQLTEEDPDETEEGLVEEDPEQEPDDQPDDSDHPRDRRGPAN